jgi:hypothetical protein
MAQEFGKYIWYMKFEKKKNILVCFLSPVSALFICSTLGSWSFELTLDVLHIWF